MVVSRPAQRAQLSTIGDRPMHFAPWNIDNGKILTRREMTLVLADLKARIERSANARFNLVLFRLAFRIRCLLGRHALTRKFVERL